MATMIILGFEINFFHFDIIFDFLLLLGRRLFRGRANTLTVSGVSVAIHSTVGGLCILRQLLELILINFVSAEFRLGLILSFFGNVVGIVGLLGESQVFNEVVASERDRSGSHDQLELDLLGLAPAEAEIEIGKLALAEGQRGNRVSLLFVAEVSRVYLDNVALAFNCVDTETDLLEKQEVTLFVIVDVFVQL